MAPPQPVEANHPDGAGRRKVLGQWFTPPALVDHVIGLALRDVRRPIRSVLDPACGDGRFLAAVGRRLGRSVRLVGVDIDEHAVSVARATVPDADILHADSLARDWGDERFDLVIGNPPFLNQLATATTRGGRSPFGGGAYASSAAEFLALATVLARDGGGRVALVLPQSVLTTRDAGPIRSVVRARAAVVHAWWSTTTVFAAAVHTCVLVLENGAEHTEASRTFGPRFTTAEPVDPGGLWGRLLIEAPSPMLPVPEPGGAVLGEIAGFTADFRDQYYGLIGAVGDDVDGPPLITSGLIDPGVCRWGERPVRFAKHSFAAPRVDLARLSPKLQRWAAQRLVPKILIANQTKLIEAVIDHDGAWLPSVPVITCTTDRLDEVWRVLSSTAATQWVRERAAGSGLSATSMRLTATLLANIPLRG
jgi:SAM-dependent methyltransferase